MKKLTVSTSVSYRRGISVLLAGLMLFLSGCGSKPAAPPPVTPSGAAPITLNQQQLQQRRQYLKDHPGVKPPPGIQIQ